MCSKILDNNDSELSQLRREVKRLEIRIRNLEYRNSQLLKSLKSANDKMQTAMKERDDTIAEAILYCEYADRAERDLEAYCDFVEQFNPMANSKWLSSFDMDEHHTV